MWATQKLMSAMNISSTIYATRVVVRVTHTHPRPSPPPAAALPRLTALLPRSRCAADKPPPDPSPHQPSAAASAARQHPHQCRRLAGSLRCWLIDSPPDAGTPGDTTLLLLISLMQPPPFPAPPLPVPPRPTLYTHSYFLGSGLC